MDVQKLITLVKKKKELAGLSDSVVRASIEKYIQKNRITASKLSSNEEKIVMKEVRAELRRLSGGFQITPKENTLLTHTSTKERENEFDVVQLVINRYNPLSILDLGCGRNPISYARPNKTYYALDINGSDLKLVDEFFKKNHITGKTLLLDIRTTTESELPKVDLCIMLKVVDLLDTQGHKEAERVLRSIRAPRILVSFSTKTLSGKPMNHPQRGWIERLAQRLGYSFELFKTKNEIFYLIEKSKS